MSYLRVNLSAAPLRKSNLQLDEVVVPKNPSTQILALRSQPRLVGWISPKRWPIRKRPCMGGSSSKAKEAKEKEKEKEKGAKDKGAASQQQHRVTPVAKRPPDATARSTPQPSPRQAASAPAAALPAVISSG